MKKIFFAAMAMVAVFASCSKNTDQFTNVPAEGYGPQVQIMLAPDPETRAFFDDTAVAETWESEITSLTVYVFNSSGNLVTKRTLTAQEITARSVRFSLPNSVAGTSCSFYAVANTDYGEITTTAAMGALLESTTLDEYNGTFEQTGLGRKRSAGFIMTDRKTSTIAAAGNSSTVSLTLKRTVAKIAVRAKLSDDFGSKYNGGTVVITSAELARAANTCYSFFDPELYRQSEKNYSHEQATRAANGAFDNMFYAYEALGVIPVRQGIYVQLKGYFDSDGSGATSADRSDVTYTIFLEASDNGAIHRNAYYRVEATIRGLSGDGVVVNTIVSDWEAPVTQTVELGN